MINASMCLFWPLIYVFYFIHLSYSFLFKTLIWICFYPCDKFYLGLFWQCFTASPLWWWHIKKKGVNSSRHKFKIYFAKCVTTIWTFRSLVYHQHWSGTPRPPHMNEPWKTNQWSPSNRNNLHLLRFSQSNSSYFETQRHPEFKRWPLQEKLSKYIWQILQILWDSWSRISLGRFQIQFSVLNFTGLLLQ